jgi:hypothetical protein
MNSFLTLLRFVEQCERMKRSASLFPNLSLFLEQCEVQTPSMFHFPKRMLGEC